MPSQPLTTALSGVSYDFPFPTQNLPTGQVLTQSLHTNL